MIDKIKTLIESIPKDKILHFSIGILLYMSISIILSFIFNENEEINISIISFLLSSIILYVDEYHIQTKSPNRNSRDVKDLLAGVLGAFSISTFLIIML